MPCYVYRCPKCQREQEFVQSIKDRIAPLCLEQGCEDTVMESVISPSTFVLKGSCWARDGYTGGGK